jgi:hypothetical protein
VNSTRGTPAGSPSGGGRPDAASRGFTALGGAQGQTGKSGRAVTAAAYVVLCLLGGLIGLVGTFQYSRGPAPLAAILFAVAILVTCVLGSAGMRTALGGVLPAVGWFVVTLALSSAGTAGGSVLITDSSAGKWFLFGGAVFAAAGAVYAFAVWSAASRDRRSR